MMMLSSCRRAIVSSSSSIRSFSRSSIVSRDFVQELYVKELKAYKPVPAAADAHVQATKAFSTQSAPKSPFLPAADELAKELEAYDAETPVVASSTAAVAAHSSIEEVEAGADAFLKLVEADIPKAEKH